MPNGEVCFNVSATMPEHGKIEAVGGDAGWLFICILAYCKRSKKDGLFPVAAVPRMSDRRQPLKLLARLAGERLIHEPGHDCKDCPQPMPEFRVVHDWPYWQGTVAEETEARQADEASREAKGLGGAYGNHRRWHLGRGREDVDCPYCDPSLMRSDMRSDTDHSSDQSSDRIPIGMRVGYAIASDDEPPFPPQTPPIPRVDINPPTPQAEPKRRTRRQAYDYSADLGFLRFWDAFPQKSGKPAAFKAWLAALARGADPEAVIAAATRYRDDPRRNPDKTKYPQGWLNDERYNDQPETGTRGRNFDF